MTKIYKSDDGARAVRERYLEMLKRWPVPNEQMRVPTRQGETFIIACGEKAARPLLLFHGSAGNSAMWMGPSLGRALSRLFDRSPLSP
jgi:hypothetical protein